MSALNIRIKSCDGVRGQRLRNGRRTWCMG